MIDNGGNEREREKERKREREKERKREREKERKREREQKAEFLLGWERICCCYAAGNASVAVMLRWCKNPGTSQYYNVFG